MDPILIPMIGVSIPVLALGGWIMETVLKSQERRMEMRLQAQQGQNEALTQQIAALRAEIAALRDTSTQYDLSVEQAVQRLEEKVARLDSKGQLSALPVPAAQETHAEETQRVGQR